MEGSRLPDFVVIGAGKSGTTSLNEYLKEHPQIFMATRKEPNFFAYETMSEDDFELERSKRFYRNSVLTIDEYLKLFEGAKPEQTLGEVSNTYLNGEHAADRIKHYIPNAKLIAILRHPADRAFSKHSHNIREGQLPPDGDLEHIFDKNSYWWRSPDMLREGMYHHQLKRFYDRFDAKDIKIILYEDFIQKTDEVVKDVFAFLGVDPSVKVGTDVVYNKSGTVKNKALDSMVGQNAGPIVFLKKFLPGLHRFLKENVTVNRWLFCRLPIFRTVLI